MSDLRTFMNYVIPSVLSFALSGVYAIVDGFFVGNTMGDMGLSAINVAYPITAVILAVGTEEPFNIQSVRPKTSRKRQ